MYERLAGPGVKAGFTHVLLTQLVTAFWHGVYPGYLIFFVGTVFYLQAASVIYRSEQVGWTWMSWVGSQLVSCALVPLPRASDR